MVALHPNVLWAQTKDKLFLTVDIQDCAKPDIKATDASVIFRGSGEGADPEPHAYGFDLDLFAPVDGASAKVAATGRHVVLALDKKEADRWPRLLKAAGKAPAFVKVDWDKWVDSDDEEAAGALPGGGMPGGFDFGDLSQFGNFENALETMGGGAGGGEEGDDDEEEVEEVEAETPAGDAGQSGSG